MDLLANKTPSSWSDAFKKLAERALGKIDGKQLWETYLSALPPAYQALVSPRHALKDLLQLEQISDYYQIEVSYTRSDIDIIILVHVPCTKLTSLLTIYRYLPFQRSLLCILSNL